MFQEMDVMYPFQMNPKRMSYCVMWTRYHKKETLMQLLIKKNSFHKTTTNCVTIQAAAWDPECQKGTQLSSKEYYDRQLIHDGDPHIK